MENASFSAGGECGEEIERALMDLGPLLGVTIKEETPDELAEGTTSRGNGRGAGAEGGGKAEGEGADSLASPTARTSFLALRCVFCQLPLSQADGTPKLMECLHSACEPCVKAKIDEKLAGSRDFLGAGRVTILCSACRLHCQPSNMIDQRFVIEKTALEQAGTNGSTSGEQQCNSCEDTEPATSYCVDCAEFICDNCVHAHQRLKITKDHTIKSKEEAVSELQAAQGGRSAHDMFCRDHPQERLALFCETCDRLTCRDCQLQHHRDHKYQFSTEMAAQARSGIAALLSEVSYKRVLLGSAMKVIRDRQALIADKKKALVHEITQTVVKLTNAINTRGKQLVLRLNEVCDGKQRTLSEKKDALEQLAAITDHCVDFVSAALDQGSDTAVLHSKRAVCAHLQRIKSRRADIPNPEIPVRISLALDKLPDLVRVLSNIGAIVVDGKVDGGATGGSTGGSTGGPAGSPGPAPAGYHSPAAPPHSAVVALQQVAMHQSYVQAVTGAGGAGVGVGGVASGAVLGGMGVGGMPGYMALPRSRAHTPLRHPHVTSTTHPHHLHGMNEMNLRGLLNAGGARGRPPAPHAPHAQMQPQHVQHAQHAYQMMGAYANGAYGASAGGAASGRRSGGPRTPSPAPHQPLAHAPHQPHAHAHAAHAPAAKWHIPQHALPAGEPPGAPRAAPPDLALDECAGAPAEPPPPGAGADYKITLGRARASSAVTSTNPKTPSPSLNGVGAGCASELDKVCAESVQDLMATIAKLDSNGVQVVAEQSGGDASPAAVHSSTDAPGRAAGDPNEDWCAVCMDGGELMCCDKCPKVFHQYCHIPTIEKLPEETESWQCLLCVNFAESGEAVEGALEGRTRRVAERLTLELYCQYELSLPFREPVPPHNRHYHQKIQQPMCLDMIRLKLQPGAEGRYTHISQFVADVRLLFRNAYRYNPPDTQIYKDAKKLEEFFDAQLAKWLPDYTYWNGSKAAGGMRLIILEDASVVADWAARFVLQRITEFGPGPDRRFVLGLPTGGTPLGMYRRLIDFYKEGRISFKYVTTFNMDEYVGLPRDHPESYHYYMWNEFFKHIDIDPAQAHVLDGNAPNLVAECQRFENLIQEAGGVRLFIGGIGPDGHIAFNEPGSSLVSRTRVKTLAYDTLEANKRFFGNDISKVPRQALTVGVGTVMDAHEVMILITGVHKALALAKAVEEGVNHMWTVSAFQQHAQALFVCDEDATLELRVKTVKYFKALSGEHQKMIASVPVKQQRVLH